MKQFDDLVSIIMPCYNVEKYLIEAIESVLKSTYTRFELIAINDGSTDNTIKILQTYASSDRRIKIINRKMNKGLVYTLNEGIVHAHGNIIVRFDSDDIILPNTIQQQVEKLKSGCDFVFGDAYIIDEDGLEYGRTYTLKYSKRLKELPFINRIIHSTVAFKKELIKMYGNYDISCVGYEDQELWYRFYKHKLNFCYISKPLVKYRISLNSCQDRDYSDYYYLIAKYLLNYSNKKNALKLIGKIKKLKNKLLICIRIFLPESFYRNLSIIRMLFRYEKRGEIYRPKINAKD